MRVVKAIGVGLAAAVLSVLLYAVVEIAVIALSLWWAQRTSTGGGGFGAVSAGMEVFLPAAVVGFAAGFWWQYRRARRAH